MNKKKDVWQGETAMYPPLRKGRLGGDDNTERLTMYRLMIANSLPTHHPLLRLPFSRGGYQLPFQLVFNHQIRLSSNPTAAAKILCYSVFENKQQTSRRPAAAVPPLRKGRLGGDDNSRKRSFKTTPANY
jgi:hypothetical protein